MKIDTTSWTQNLSSPGRPDEHETKQLLDRIGIAVPEGVRLTPGSEVETPPFQGPYALKVCSPEVLHKTERGGVRLGIDLEDLPAAVAAMRGELGDLPLLVERMIDFEGAELIVGGLVDETLGTAVMVGAGGILTELYRDVAFRLAPCPPDEARRMIEELRISPLFHGFRGLELDPDGLAETIGAVAELAAGFGARFDQLDINPLVYSEGRWTALDAGLVLEEETED
ncbi:MAG: acetate--CoA ligase family protein [Polyangia bacterium]